MVGIKPSRVLIFHYIPAIFLGLPAWGSSKVPLELFFGAYLATLPRRWDASPKVSGPSAVKHLSLSYTAMA